MSTNARRSSSQRIAAIAIVGALAVAAAACVEPPTEPADRSRAPTSGDAAGLTVAPDPGCVDGVQESGALYQVCFPAEWNGDLVVWAHGYANPVEDIAIPDDEVDGQPIWEIVNGLGYAFATTSYSDNGLVAVDAVADLEDLPGRVREDYGVEPVHAYLVGASEGGLSTVLAIEEASTEFDGGLATCGPIGRFRRQINHFGDFRAVFDYFFRGVMPGDAISIPPGLVTLEEWKKRKLEIENALAANPRAAEQLLRVTRVPVEDPSDPASVAETVTDLLWYSFFATNDARSRLGGNPYDNRYRIYTGSDNDFLLNIFIRRYRADRAALGTLAAFETTGGLRRPAVTLHTTADPIVPYWHEPLYNLKTWKTGSRLQLTSLPAFRHGHCNFTLPEVLAGFAVLVLRVSARDLVATAEVFPSVDQEQRFLELARQQGAQPTIVRQKEHPIRR
ncbi:MAG: hypothetical protein PVJ64_07270 [Gemmatimonadales bacterium]|jgi:hypothetical protein